MEFISRSDILKLFGISVWTLRRWQKNCQFPNPIRASGKVRMYRTKEVNDWLNSRAENEGIE